MQHNGTHVHPRQSGDPLAAYRSRWLIGRHPGDPAALTALRRPTASSVHLIVAFSPVTLAARIAVAEARDLLAATFELPARGELAGTLTRYRRTVVALVEAVMLLLTDEAIEAAARRAAAGARGRAERDQQGPGESRC